MRHTARLALFLLATAGLASACGQDEDPNRRPATPGPAPSAGPTSEPSGDASADAFRSFDPAVAGPALFGALRRYGESASLTEFFQLLPKAKADEMRGDLRATFTNLQNDPQAAKAAQERVGLSKSPADINFEEFLAETSAATRHTGATQALVDQECGTTYLDARLEGPDRNDRARLVIRGEGQDMSGAPIVLESVFVWADGKWGFSPEESKDRAMGLERRVPIATGLPGAFAFQGDDLLIAHKGLTRHTNHGEVRASRVDLGWIGRLRGSPARLLVSTEHGWRHLDAMDLGTAKVALPAGIRDADLDPSGHEALLSTPSGVVRLDLTTGAVSVILNVPEGDPQAVLVRALPGDRVLVRRERTDAAVLEALARRDGTRSFVLPLGEIPSHLEIVVDVGGQVIAVAEEEIVRLYRADDGSFLRKVSGNGRVQAIAVAPDGRHLAIATSRVQVLRVSDGVVVRTLSNSPGSVTPPLAWSSDGKRLAAWIRTGHNLEQETNFVGVYRFE